MKKKIKILLVLDSYYPDIDGPTVLLEKCALELNKRADTEADIMVPAYPNFKDREDINIIRIKSIQAVRNFRLPLPFLDRKFKALLKNNNYDIIHIHSPFVLGKASIKLAKKHNIPSVITMHTKFKDDFDRVLKTPVAKNFAMKYILNTMSNANHVFTVSNHHKSVMNEYGFFGEMFTVKNATEMTYPSNEAQILKFINDKYNLVGQKNIFISVGRLVSNKRLEFIVKILKVLKDRGVDFKFLFVGTGDFESELKRMVHELNLESMVIFTGKIYDREELQGLFLRSDLMIFPSIYDVASLTLIEAASAKTPTILEKNTSTAENVIDNFNGFLAQGDENKWADSIEKVIAQPELMKQTGENAYKTLVKNWQQVTDEMVAYYKQFLNKK